MKSSYLIQYSSIETKWSTSNICGLQYIKTNAEFPFSHQNEVFGNFRVTFTAKNPGIQNGYPQPVVIRYCCFFSSFKKHCCILNELVKRKQTRTYAGRRYRAPIQNRDVLRNFSFWYIKLSVGWNQITVILLKFLSVLARRSCTFSWQRFCWDRFVANT